MLGLKKEDIEGFLEFQPTNMSDRRILWTWYLFFVMFAIPTAIFGAYTQITKPIILPLTVVLGIWTVYLSIGIENKKPSFTLFHGILGFLISVVCLLAAYKMLLTIMNVSVVTVFGVLSLYAICVVLNVMNVLRLIKKGYYQTKKTQVVATGTTIAAGVVGMGIARAMKGKISQHDVVIFLACVFAFFAFIGLLGTQNFLKYYLMKSLDK